MNNDIQEFVENNPDDVTLFGHKGYDYYVFIQKLDSSPWGTITGTGIKYPLYENEICIEVECWNGGDSVRRTASIKKSQFDIWLRDKKINTIVDEME
jgi:hypothetical protein